VWSPGARLLVAKAQHEIAAARRQHRPQAVDELDAVLFVEDVKQPAVEHGVETLPEIGQVTGILAQKPSHQPSLACLVLGGAKRVTRQVNAGGIKAPAGTQQHVLTGATADV
jgi:hypothetical protein